MAENVEYFTNFYRDLSSHRFSLIISEPLRAPIKDSSYQFGEENNSWVQWVVKPVRCYYQPILNDKDIQVQLLVPKQGELDCSSKLPFTFEEYLFHVLKYLFFIGKSFLIFSILLSYVRPQCSVSELIGQNGG